MTPPRHVAFYGSLMAGLHLGGEPGFAPMVRLVGPCLIPGRLYEVAGGAYPGLELAEPDGSAVVRGELHEVLDERALALLDEWEEFDPSRPDRSPYVRQPVALLDPPVVAWVYVGHHRQRGPVVPDGDWRRHVQRRG